MKKILFLIHDLGHGGAEKVLVNLVNNRHYGCIQDLLSPEKAQMLYNTNESDIILRRSTEEATLPEAALVRRRQVTRNKGFDRMLRI